ncbi:HNH endonuclease signature motif containing protein, partial [Georgenia sp.]
MEEQAGKPEGARDDLAAGAGSPDRATTLGQSGSAAAATVRTHLGEALGVVGRIRAACGEGGGASSWAHEDREAVINGIDTLIRDLTLARGRVLLAHREDGRWGTSRDRDYADWRARVTGTGRGSALGEIRVAEGLAAMPEVAAAVETGELNLEHARALARLRADASPEVKAVLESGGAAELVARGKKLTAPELAREAKKVAAEIDAAAAQESFEAVWRRRSVRTSARAGGRTGEWFLDAVGGAIVDHALDAIVGKPAVDDARSREQRRADALVTMASRVLQVGADLTGAQIRPHLSVLVEEETWAAVRRHRLEAEGALGAAVDARAWPGAGLGLGPDGAPQAVGDLEATGKTTARSMSAMGCTLGRAPDGGKPAWPAVAPAELEDGTVVPLGELERLMCDCEMTRVVMDADSQVLDVGMTQRTYERELRRAVVSRDRRCMWPGCGIRATWCEVHHLVWVSRGGVTSMENGMCACSYHHHVIHRDNITVVTLTDGFGFYGADGALLGTTHRPERRSRRKRRSVTASGTATNTTTDAAVAVEVDVNADAGDGRAPTGDAELAALVASWPPTGRDTTPPDRARRP